MEPSSATDLLIRLRASDFTVRIDWRADPHRLLIHPISKLGGELRRQAIACRQELLALLHEEADAEARIRAIDAVAPPHLDDDNPVVLDTIVLIQTSGQGEPPEYLAVNSQWLDDLREFSRMRKRDKAEAAQRRAQRTRQKSRVKR